MFIDGLATRMNPGVNEKLLLLTPGFSQEDRATNTLFYNRFNGFFAPTF